MTLETLEALTVDELGDLIDRAKATRVQLIASRKAELKAEFAQRLEAEGFSITDVVCADCPKAEKANAKRQRKTMPPKYAHPDKPELTWSGLGRKPGWLQELLTAGIQLEHCRMRT